MSKTYFVSLDVIYTTVVEAENEEEAIEKATHKIELDVDPSVEPLVAEWEDGGVCRNERLRTLQEQIYMGLR